MLYVITRGEDEPHGLAIKKEVHHSRLYPNHAMLVDKGLVKKGQQDRRTNYYVLTNRERREIKARHDWEDMYIESAPSI